MDNFNIDQCILSYLSHCKYEKGLSFQTLKAYQIDLEQFAQFIKNEMRSPSKDVLQSYISSLRQQYKIKSEKRKIASPTRKVLAALILLYPQYKVLYRHQ